MDQHPKVDGPALADFAVDLCGMIEQLILPGKPGLRESGLMMPAKLRHIMIWDPVTGGPAQSFFSGPFIKSALWRGRMLLGDHIDNIGRCERCENFFMVRKGAKSAACGAPRMPARRVSSATWSPKKQRVRQRDYYQRLRRKDPAAADRYLSRLRATDPAAARWLKSWASPKNEPARRRMRSDPGNK